MNNVGVNSNLPPVPALYRQKFIVDKSQRIMYDTSHIHIVLFNTLYGILFVQIRFIAVCVKDL